MLITHHNMLALTRKQPYAYLMLHGKIETRTWSTNYRGPVLFCAGKKGFSEKELLLIAGEEQYERIKHITAGQELPEGVAFATGTLIDCRPMYPEDEDMCFVAYKPTLRCHIYADVKAITPFPFKGAQRWTHIPSDLGTS